MEENIKCNCNEECNCDEECNCNEECNCAEECSCEECNCSDESLSESEQCSCNEQNQSEKLDCEKDEKKLKHKEKKDKTKKLEDKILELKEQLKDSENKVLLAKAEMINYRKRKDEDVSRILKYANEDLILEMLPVIDNFESAIKMDDENLDDEVSKFLQGFKMIYCNMINILEKNDVKVIDGVNKPFDPTYHQAVMTEKSDLESGMIIEVLRKGYILKEKVIRPAMVKVSE